MTRHDNMSSRKQEPVYSESNFSLDSLDEDFKTKMSVRHTPSSEHSEDLDTILVPFYDKDVLVKVPKEQKRKQNKQGPSKDKEIEPRNTSYLVNKDVRKTKRPTYLDMFRKKFAAPQKPNLKSNEDVDICSLSPEFGDTDRDSIGEDASHPVAEFYNTESYNEIFYEKLLTQDLENYISSYEDELNKEDVNIDSKLQQEMAIENLKSVSEVSQINPPARRGTIKQPMPNVKLGGLGPDVEKIKPRLERARSLQRYSEKVRMENRLRIYKKTVQQENDKVERESSASQRKQRTEPRLPVETSVSYLVNKSTTRQKSPQIKLLSSVSKSADPKIGRTALETVYVTKNKPPSRTNNKNTTNNNTNIEPVANTTRYKQRDTGNARAKSSTRNKGINTEIKTTIEIPPVHINFMVNMGGMRPTSALMNLEEKHRMYQEQVKAFRVDDE